MAELAYAGEGTIRKAYSRDQETLPTQTHRDLCGRRREEEYSFLEGCSGKGGRAWPPIISARTRSRQSANWGPLMSP